MLLSAGDLNNLLALDRAANKERVRLLGEEDFGRGDVLSRLQRIISSFVRSGKVAWGAGRVSRRAGEWRAARMMVEKDAGRERENHRTHLAVPKLTLLSTPNRKYLARLAQEERERDAASSSDDLLPEQGATDAREGADVLLSCVSAL